MNLSGENVNYDVNLVRQTITELLDGPDLCVGYRSIWHALKLRGIIVPRLVVQQLMQEMDPEGVQARKANELRRRQYHSPAPHIAFGMRMGMTNSNYMVCLSIGV